MRVPWTAKRSNQSILKEIKPKYLLEGPILKLKFQNFGYLMQRPDLLEKPLMLGKIEGKKRRGWQRIGWLDTISDSVDMSLKTGRQWRIQGKPAMLQSMGSQRVTRDLRTEQ